MCSTCLPILAAADATILSDSPVRHESESHFLEVHKSTNRQASAYQFRPQLNRNCRVNRQPFS